MTKKKSEIRWENILVWFMIAAAICYTGYQATVKQTREEEQRRINNTLCIRAGGDEYLFWSDTCQKVLQERKVQEIDYKLVLPID